MLESRLQSNIVKWLNAQPGTVARVNGPGPAHVVGDPDIYGCVYGLMFHMEVKLPNGVITEAQNHRLQEWRAAGAEAFVVRSLDEAKAAQIEVACLAIDHGLYMGS